MKGSLVITISFFRYNMFIMIKDSIHLLGQELQMPLLGLALGFSNILDSKSWSI